jgi:hypothetical protein
MNILVIPIGRYQDLSLLSVPIPDIRYLAQHVAFAESDQLPITVRQCLHSMPYLPTNTELIIPFADECFLCKKAIFGQESYLLLLQIQGN